MKSGKERHLPNSVTLVVDCTEGNQGIPMIRMFVEVFSSILGIALGALVIIVAAKAGQWGLDAFGFWGGVIIFPIVLLGGTGLLYLWLREGEGGA